MPSMVQLSSQPSGQFSKHFSPAHPCWKPPKHLPDYGDFCIEIYTEDELLLNEEFKVDNLKFTKIEGLEQQKGKIELISNDRIEGMEELLESKKSFILAQFKNCLQDNDDVNYLENQGNKCETEEEDINYDEF